jgi:hypothetical protein
MASMGDKRGSYRVLKRKSEKAHLEDRRRWTQDIIKMELQEKAWGSMVWIDQAQDRDRRRLHVNAVMNLGVCDLISGFPCEAAENCAFLGYYAANSGRCVITQKSTVLNLRAPHNVRDILTT